jgi:hypothetical protein
MNTKRNIRSMLNKARVVLFSDDEHFNKDITGVTSLSDIKSWFLIKGDLVKTCAVGNRLHYRLRGSNYAFCLVFVE